MSETDDYALFRRRLRDAEAEANRWRTLYHLAVQGGKEGRAVARKELVEAGLITEPKFETCPERRARRDRERRAYRWEQREAGINEGPKGGRA